MWNNKLKKVKRISCLVLTALFLVNMTAFAESTVLYKGRTNHSVEVTECGNYSTVMITKVPDNTDQLSEVSINDIYYLSQAKDFFDATSEFMLKANPEYGEYKVQLGSQSDGVRSIYFNVWDPANTQTPIRIDEKNLKVTYQDAVEVWDDGYVYVAAYKENRLIGVGVSSVKKGENNVKISADISSYPDTVKVISLSDTLCPIGEMKTNFKYIPEKEFIDSFVDFTVEVEEDRDIVVLQLTDPQIIDASQARSGRTGVSYSYWGPDKMEDRCFGYMRETIESVNPDFIILTGDLVYGEFDDSGTSMIALIEFMESFGIPWAPVFGNHDNESAMGADWQCEQLEKAEHCLFKQRELTGNGNYSVGIVQGNKLKRVFYMLDSNGCGAMSDATRANGHSKSSAGFGNDQVEWFENSAYKIKEEYPDTRFSFAFHIQPSIFENALSKYGLGTQDLPINIDETEDKSDGDFGYIGRGLKSPWDASFEVYNKIKNLGADSIFVGHEHLNSASVVYDGIRFQYGQKSSTYDRANYVLSDGTIQGSYSNIGTPIMGGTVLILSEENGDISNAYIHYYEE